MFAFHIYFFLFLSNVEKKYFQRNFPVHFFQLTFVDINHFNFTTQLKHGGPEEIVQNIGQLSKPENGTLSH